jgi:hypothetical protein
MSAWLLAGETAAASKGAYAQPSSSTALMSSGITPSSSNAAAMVYMSSYMSSSGVHAEQAWISRSSLQQHLHGTDADCGKHVTIHNAKYVFAARLRM